MEEKVVINLLEANKQLPSKEEVLRNFSTDLMERLEESLANPDRVVASSGHSVAQETLVLREEERGVDSGSSDVWKFAEETNASGFDVPEERGEEPAPEESAAEAAEEAEGSLEELSSLEEPAEERFAADEAAGEEPAVEEPVEDEFAELPHELDTGELRAIEAQQEAVESATQALLDGVSGQEEQAQGDIDLEMAPLIEDAGEAAAAQPALPEAGASEAGLEGEGDGEQFERSSEFEPVDEALASDSDEKPADGGSKKKRKRRK